MGNYETDEYLKTIYRMMLEDEKGISIVNPLRLRQYLNCLQYIKMIFAGTGAKIISKVHDEDFPSIGTIEISAREIIIPQPELFGLTARLASNFEIYPKLDGTLQMTLTFHGMTKKAGEMNEI